MVCLWFSTLDIHLLFAWMMKWMHHILSYTEIISGFFPCKSVVSTRDPCCFLWVAFAAFWVCSTLGLHVLVHENTVEHRWCFTCYFLVSLLDCDNLDGLSMRLYNSLGIPLAYEYPLWYTTWCITFWMLLPFILWWWRIASSPQLRQHYMCEVASADL